MSRRETVAAQAVVVDWDAVTSDPDGEPQTSLEHLRQLQRTGVDVAFFVRDTANIPDLLAWQTGGLGQLWLGCISEATLAAIRNEQRDERWHGKAGRVGTSELLAALEAQLAGRGIGSSQIHVMGPRLRKNIDEQFHRRRSRRVPDVDLDPDWTIVETEFDRTRERAIEARFTLSSGLLGTRGCPELPRSGSMPLVLHSGLFTGAGPAQHLLPGPLWTSIDTDVGDRSNEPTAESCVLDLRTGMLQRSIHFADGKRLFSLRFASAARAGLVGMRVETDLAGVRAEPALRAPPDVSTGDIRSGENGGDSWLRVAASSGGGVAAVASQRLARDGELQLIERVAAYVSDQRRPPRLAPARRLLADAQALGFDGLLAEQRETWARRWSTVDVCIPSDSEAQRALRFALFHLWGLTNSHEELAMGARGVSGPGYAGHVLWDADAFVLPALAAMDAAAAAAMVRYRLHRLDAARAAARAAGRDGARFPWESAVDGSDVTARSGWLGKNEVSVDTEQPHEHITADVAWAAVHLSDWTGRRNDQRVGYQSLLADTARYWASRAIADADGSWHIRGVTGPDDYHENVDDNAFTNVMARWNLRTAMKSGDATVTAAEARRWGEIARGLVDGYDAATGRYEQFTGFFALEPLTVAQIAQPPVAADILLGKEGVAASQLSKQPDVLLLHRLVPQQVVSGSLGPNLDFYLPRTAHGSSLSPAVCAELLAQAGRTDDALRLFRIALTLDEVQTSAITAAGLHMGNLGSTWHALLGGFAGVSVRDRTLTVEPRLPQEWPELTVRFTCLGRRLRLTITKRFCELSTDGPVRVRIGDRPPRVVRHSVHVDHQQRRAD